MTIDAATLAAIVAMMAATVFTRLSGAFLINRLEMSPRLEKALKAVPPAVLMAVVTPTAIGTGWAETTGCAIVALASLRMPLLPAAASGVVVVALLRASGF